MADVTRKVDPAPYLQGVMKRLEAIFPGHGLALLVFDFNKIEAGRMNWVSNAHRADMVAALREMAAQLEGRAHPAPPSQQ
ncbi:hypothetical protein [Phreatobacter sp.]|uniref:hypothetical protein n=1 Tax=Phreatobacter sp. TaxID=1966341 RepID=UPI003F70D7FD